MTDEEIEKEREQVKKLLGAKSAMEAALSRIKTLENAMHEMHNRYSEIAGCVGAGVVVKSRFARGRWQSDPEMASVNDLKEGVDRLLAKHTGPTS